MSQSERCRSPRAGAASHPRGCPGRRAGSGAPTCSTPSSSATALVRSFVMLDPTCMVESGHVLVEVGTVLTAIVAVAAMLGQGGQAPVVYQVALDLWLWATVLFANFAEALAEARGKAQADACGATRQDTPAYRLRRTAAVEPTIVSTELRAGDRVVVEAGQVIPADGEIVEGVASVDESAITGETAPVIREAGGDHSGVTGGTRVLSDRIVVQVTAEAGRASSTG